jgi:GGDEF domain-containing protein
MLMTAIFNRLSTIVRDSDIIGALGKNRIVVLLPMTSGSHARLALRRSLKLLHESSITVEGTSTMMRFAGIAAAFEPVNAATATAEASAFVRTLMQELAQMETRIKNLQAYF